MSDNDIQALLSSLESLSDEELHDRLRSDSEFTEHFILGMPDVAADRSFDFYGKEWLHRYWKRIVSEVASVSPSSNDVMKWAGGASAAALAALITKHFNLPDIAVPASIALSILIMRTAKPK